MTLVTADRVKETCSHPGTSSVSLLGAVTGFQAFSAAIGNGNTCYYCIADQSGANWEVGIGTYASSGNTLARTTILASSNSGSAVNFSSGTQDVFVTYPAERVTYTVPSVNITALIVAGGGGGGTISNGGRGAGGGAGGLLYYGAETPKSPNGTALNLAVGSVLTVTVGAGGAVCSSVGTGDGGTSSLAVGGGTTYTALGGGGGAYNDGVVGHAGGCGGGGCNNNGGSGGCNSSGGGGKCLNRSSGGGGRDP